MDVKIKNSKYNHKSIKKTESSHFAKASSGEQINYNHKIIEAKWQKIWKRAKLYKADDSLPNNYYLLVELAYTSGDLHMGHWFAWVAPDAYARFKRMQGFNVLFPVGGFDAFGLPAENAAIKHGIHPREWTYKNIENMRAQFEKMGPSFDWEREVITSDSDYYRWTQWLFIQLFKKGLAYKGKVWSNWCPECKTVLANEHVVNGCCWRHTETAVEQKEVEQWLIRITDYADRLIWPKNPKVDWPQAAIEGQNNWIGRKEGIEIRYPVINTVHSKSSVSSDVSVTVWTSRPDTNFGASFIVVSPEYALKNLIQLISKDRRKKVEEYIKRALNKTEQQRKEEEKVKTGVFTGLYAVNQLNNYKMPVWVSDFVLASFGTGAVVGVPGHDRRDFEFAKKFKLPIKRVVVGEDGDTSEITRIEQVQEKEGTMINSEFLDGLRTHDAIQRMMDYIEEKGWGKRSVQYHLRDWSVSRQRYWAAPVPMIYCEKCAKRGRGWFNTREHKYSGNLKNRKARKSDRLDVEENRFSGSFLHNNQDDWNYFGWWPVDEKDLPVKLPEVVDYTPTGKPPLATALGWVKVKCPECGYEAKREVETLDTYVDSSWYFFRYPTPKYSKGPFDPKIIREWMPIKVYFGGPEHILGHTLYARFITKFFYDLGLIDFDEFALRRVHHGVILGPDGYRMSKSRGNVVNPDEQVKKFGADSVRVYINFLGPHDKGGAWKTEGIEGAFRFLNRVWKLICNYHDVVVIEKKDAEDILRMQHKTIKKVSDDIERLHTHTAIAALMEYVNLLYDVVSKNQKSNIRYQDENSKLKNYKTNRKIRCAEWDEAVRTLVLLLAPFAPHIAEELYQRYFAKTNKQFNSVHLQAWPSYNSELIKEEMVTIAVQINGKLRGTLKLSSDEAGDAKAVIKVAKESENIAKWLKGKIVEKEIFVAGKLINFVLG